jgi:hypothetical protein
VSEIIGACVARDRASVEWRAVLQELHAWPGGRAKGRDAQAGAGNVVESLLFRTPVFACAGDAKSEGVAVTGETPCRVGDDDGGMVDSEEEPFAGDTPARVALARRTPGAL